MSWKVSLISTSYDDVTNWKPFSRYWPFERGIHRSPVNFPHKAQWCGALMFSLICVWINGWVNNGEAGDLRRYRALYDVIVMIYMLWKIMSYQQIRITLLTSYSIITWRYKAIRWDSMQYTHRKKFLLLAINLIYVCSSDDVIKGDIAKSHSPSSKTFHHFWGDPVATRLNSYQRGINRMTEGYKTFAL